jgi:hypothetical protein
MTSEDHPQTEARVVLDHPETQNLLGLLLRTILENNLSDEAIYARVRAVRGEVQVQAGEMVITLRFEEGRVTIVSGPSESPRASVRGDMGAFLGVARGTGVVGPFLSGAVKIGGNPLLLLKLIPLLQVKKGDRS